jgi:hypothetical protein
MEVFLHRMKLQGDILYSYYTEKDFDTYHLDDEEA